jgi:hypothetical protein
MTPMGKSVAYYCFLPLLIAFLAYVGAGYYLTFRTIWPTVAIANVILLCLLLLALIFILVRHTGHAIYKTRMQRGWRRLTWVPLFLLLFCFSGYGFLTSSMLIFVGPDIARDDVSHLLTDIAHLKTQAASSVTLVPDYAAYNTLVTAIANDRDQLQSEIRSRAGGNTCGIGPGAKALINTINGLVSGHNLAIHMLTGLSTTHSCADKKQIDTIATAYDSQIGGILDKLAEQFGVASRQKTADAISTALKDDEAALKAVNDSLSGVENFAFNLSIYQAALRAIEKASLDYNAQRAQLPGPLTEQADAGQLERLGSGLDLLDVMWSRKDQIKIYLLLIFALGCDVLAAWVISIVFERQADLRREYDRASQATNIGGSGVIYLWLPEPNPLANTSAKKNV